LRRRGFVAAALLAGLVLSGCSPISPVTPAPSAVRPVQATGTATTNAADEAAAQQVIESTNLADSDSIDAVAGIRFTPAGEQAARVVLVSGPSGDALWAATWVYASSARDPAPLRPLLQNPDASIRAIAASALISVGDRAGFAVLGASLSESHRLTGSDPPQSIGEFALSSLARYIQSARVPAPPTGASDLQAAEAKWASWLAGHADGLQFDPASRTWRLL
jgi:hypothetical protein